jgi:hypothetical protein
MIPPARHDEKKCAKQMIPFRAIPGVPSRRNEMRTISHIARGLVPQKERKSLMNGIYCLWLPAAVVLVLMATCVPARAGTIVYIDSMADGCSYCNGPENVLPGTSVYVYSPRVQVTLGPGTYDITNAAASGYYSGWNYQGYPSSSNWTWGFLAVNDANSLVMMDDYIGATLPTQADVANATGITTYDGNTVLSATSTAAFADTLTLAATTTIDFVVDDYQLGDNGGGVALDIEPAGSAPEPASWLLFGLGLVGIGAVRSKSGARRR